MDLAELLPIVAVLMLGAISPGPSLAAVLHCTLKGGASRGVACGAGHGLGFGIYAFVAISGIALLKLEGLSQHLEVAGGIFLITLGVLTFRASEEEVSEDGHDRDGFILGFLIAFLNPKILAFQLAVFSQFVQPDFSMLEIATIAVIALCIDGGWYIFVALIVGKTALLDRLEARKEGLSRLMAAAFIGYGIWILWP